MLLFELEPRGRRDERGRSGGSSGRSPRLVERADTIVSAFADLGKRFSKNYLLGVVRGGSAKQVGLVTGGTEKELARPFEAKANLTNG